VKNIAFVSQNYSPRSGQGCPGPQAPRSGQRDRAPSAESKSGNARFHLAVGTPQFVLGGYVVVHWRPAGYVGYNRVCNKAWWNGWNGWPPAAGRTWGNSPMAATRRTSLFLAMICSLICPVACICGDTARSKATSADGQLVANFYERDCGATTDFSSQVNVQRTSDRFRAGEGVLFIAKGRYDLSVAWTGPRTLLITCPGCARENIFREVAALGDIDVKYSLGPGQ